MKKLATLGLSLLIGVSSIFAAVPVKRAAGPSSGALPKGKPIEVSSTMFKAAGQNAAGYNLSSSTAKVRMPFAIDGTLKAPAKANVSGSTIYGGLMYDGGHTVPIGITEVFPDGKYSSIVPIEGPNGGNISIVALYVRDGHFYCIAREIFMGIYLMGDYVFEYDMDGKLLNMTTYGDEDIMFSNATYDVDTDKLYGYVFTSTASYFCTADGATPNVLTSVKEVTADRLLALTYNSLAEKFIGITKTGKVVEINSETGAQTEVATLANPSKYNTGLCYSPFDSMYYYAVCTDNEATLQTLDETNFSVLSSTPFISDNQFGCFYCPDVFKINDGAPASPTLVNTIFADGALSGALTYKLANVTYGGTPILGDIDWILDVDGKEVKRGKGAAGSDVTVTVSDLTEGIHIFRFRTSLGGNEGRYLIDSFYVGDDTPSAPATVTLDTTTISWTPVSTGINNGYVNPAEVTYNVYLNDKMIAEGIKATSVGSHLPQGTVLDTYVASVEAIFKGKVSDRTSSNDLNYGEPFNLPEHFTPTQREAGLFTIVDANNDGAGIEYGTYNFGTEQYSKVPLFVYNYSEDNDADDWLFLPVTNYDDADAVYEFSMNAFRTDGNYPEKFEVMLCSAPNAESVVKTLIAPTTLLNPATMDDLGTVYPENVDIALNQYFSTGFDIPSAGQYYIGIHAISEAYMAWIFMRDFKVRKVEGMSTAAPTVATDLSAVCGAEGALNATVTFTFPTGAVNGTPYEADKILTASVQAEGCAAVKTTGKPAETVSVVVPTKQGDNEISVIVKDGEMESLPATIGIYTGSEAPGTVENLTATVDETDYNVLLTWEAPAEGNNGGYVQPTGITYFLCEKEGNSWTLSDKIGTDVFEYTYSIPEGTTQNLMQLGIIAVNFVGQADYLTSVGFVAGKPFDVPFVNNFRTTAFTQPIVNYTSGVTIQHGDPKTAYPDFSTTDNSTALYSKRTYSSPVDAHMTLPKVTTKNTLHPAVNFEVYGGSTSSFTINASAPGIEEKAIKTFEASSFTEKGPQSVKVELPDEFAGKGWVELSIDYVASKTESMIIYGYKVYDNVEFDFGVTSIEGPAIANIGEEAKYTAHVTNFGSKANPIPASGWKLVDADGNVVTEVSIPAGTEAVEPDAEVTFDIAFTPNADQTGAYTLTYTIEKADNKEFNDTLDKEIAVEKGVIPVVTDLAAKEISYDNVTLEWTPAVTASKIVESFEEETPMVLDDVTGMLAQFKRVDGDGLRVYGPNSENYENLPTAFQPQSFVTWSQSEMTEALGFTGNYTAHSGDKFIIAFCPLEASETSDGIAPADDWLISPQVIGGTDFSFAIKPLTYMYGAETVEIMYSTTGDKPEDFKLLETLELDGDDPEAAPTWEELTYTLPEDAKYFAFHYISKDVFGIILDDIAYSPVGSDVKITGYDIYRDGQLIAANAPCADSTYTDDTVAEDTEYVYMIMPVLDNGTKGLESNKLKLHTTGIGSIDADADADAEYFNLQGLPVRGKLEPGVYIRRQGGKTVKVIVAK